VDRILIWAGGSMKRNCVSEEALMAMVDEMASVAEMADAMSHMQQCTACEERYRAALELEIKLRREVVKVRRAVATSDVDALVYASLQMVKESAAQQVHAAVWKEHLLDVLAPLCGKRLTERSIHLASRESFQAEDVERVTEQEWNHFVSKLGNILFEICGATVRNAVHHLSVQALAGAA
jgi:hypothetical protein